MSDFIFSSTSKLPGELTNYIKSIYHSDPPDVQEYHSTWGSLGVSRNLYHGLQPLETEEHIFVVVGGPVLCFRDNNFLKGSEPLEGTRAIYERWLSGKMQWDEDLSGPFTVLIVDKKKTEVICITDLLMFIPVYQYNKNGSLMLGTHVDALANSTGQTLELDLVSLADFILNDAVTFPHTVYKNIDQCHPAAVHQYKLKEGEIRPKSPAIFWVPQETNYFDNIKEAARTLREGVEDYVYRVTDGMTQVAHFISAGEDSRVISGIIPRYLSRDAYIFLDSMNREGRIAGKVARAYGANFRPEYRDDTFYLDILPEASDLIGSGHQYHHAHTLTLHKTCGLTNYSAVFGGYLSDNLLKALFTRKIRGQWRFPFLPQFFIPGENRSKPQKSPIFNNDVLKEIDSRRKLHLAYIKKFRKETVHEWFLWPNMRPGAPNFDCNRRLFRCLRAVFMQTVS